MRLRQSQRTLLAAFILPTIVSAVGNLNCEDILEDGVWWNLKELAGVHTITHLDDSRPPGIFNSTYYLDICRTIKFPKEIPDNERCELGTYVCGIVKTIDESGELQKGVTEIIPIAGNYELSSGKSPDVKYTRLKTSSAHEDTRHEGLRMELGGGAFGKPEKKQKAVIEFWCKEGADKDRETEKGDGNKKNDEAALETVDDGHGGSIEFRSYDDNIGDMGVLQLRWHTEHACEDAEGRNRNKSGGWGFFSWFFLIVFLSLLLYLVFGAWLNYSRYGARGWDLLPHGDIIRDMPYILQDWFRKVVDTIQGGGSRGGYSAV